MTDLMNVVDPHNSEFLIIDGCKLELGPGAQDIVAPSKQQSHSSKMEKIVHLLRFPLTAYPLD